MAERNRGTAAPGSSSDEGTMRVVEIEAHGGPDRMVVGRRDLPVPGPGEVRVRVRAAGVNRADLLQRQGRYPAPPGYPQEIPGLEYAGVVDRVGPGCTLRRSGDRVMGITGGGGYAEALVVRERETIRAPENATPVEAGAIPEVFVTAWDALVLQVGLRSGETVLLHAVGSGVGTAAVQLARLQGARSVGTSRTAEKVERAREMGLDHGVVAEAGGGWPEEVRAVTGGAGVDVILDLVGAPYLAGNLDILGTGGRWIVVGVPGGAAGEVDLRKLMVKRASVRGTVLRARPPEEKALLAREFERLLVPAFEAGRLRPVVDRALPAEAASDAHRIMESNRNFGKLVLTWGGGAGWGGPDAPPGVGGA